MNSYLERKGFPPYGLSNETEFDEGMEEAAKNIARGFKAVGN